MATFKTIGDLLGDAVFAAQKAEGEAFIAAHPSDGDLSKIGVDSVAFSKKLSEVMGSC